MDYEDILNYIESIVEEIEFEEIPLLEVKEKLQELIEVIVEEIEFEEISIPEIKGKLQELIVEIESNRGMGGRDLEDFDFN
jgi:hypothetical protein